MGLSGGPVFGPEIFLVGSFAGGGGTGPLLTGSAAGFGLGDTLGAISGPFLSDGSGIFLGCVTCWVVALGCRGGGPWVFDLVGLLGDGKVVVGLWKGVPCGDRVFCLGR